MYIFVFCLSGYRVPDTGKCAEDGSYSGTDSDLGFRHNSSAAPVYLEEPASLPSKLDRDSARVDWLLHWRMANETWTSLLLNFYNHYPVRGSHSCSKRGIRTNLQKVTVPHATRCRTNCGAGGSRGKPGFWKCSQWLNSKGSGPGTCSTNKLPFDQHCPGIWYILDAP